MRGVNFVGKFVRTGGRGFGAVMALSLCVVLASITVAASPTDASKASVSTGASTKKTVCTITINSPQERELFRKKLPANRFRIVELIPDSAPGLAWIEGWAGANWFKKACEKRIQCDILVISGHFAGTFFGRSGQSLALSELEKASCQSSCDGLFKRPKEVYLFGCNTLADKTRDHRRPEDYVEVLRADGFSVAEAQAVAEQRYTPWGASNLDRMRSLFPNVVGLYGFSSTSPLGKYIEAPLGRYLEERAAGYADELATMKKGDRNQKLARALKDFSFRQADVSTPAAPPLVCRMNVGTSVQGSAIADLKLISQSLHSEEPLRDLPQILEKLRQLKATNGTDLQVWTQNEAPLKTRLLEIFRSPEMRAHFVVRLGVLELIQFLSSAAEVEAPYRALLSETLKSLSSHRAQEICAQRGSTLIQSQRLPKEWVLNFGNQTSKSERERLYGAMSCLNFATDPAWFGSSLPESFLFSQDWSDSRSSIAEALRRESSRPEAVLLMAAMTMKPLDPAVAPGISAWLKTPSDAAEFLERARVARRIREDAKLILIERTRIAGVAEVRAAWIQLWRAQPPTSETLQGALFEHARRESDPSSWLAIFAGTELHPRMRERLTALIRDPQVQDRRFILNLLSRLSVEGEGLYGLALAMTADPEAGLRAEAVDVLTRYFWEAVDPALEPRMLAVIRDDRDESVLDEALHFWAKRGTRDVQVLKAIDEVWQRTTDEYGDLRRTATDVMAHLAVADPVRIDEWWSRLMKAPSFGEVESQLLQMLASAEWKNHALHARLIKRFERDLTSEDPRRRGFAFKALLRNGEPDAKFLDRAARELESMVHDQNWLGARDIGYVLGAYRSHPRVARALQRFEAALEASLDEI